MKTLRIVLMMILFVSCNQMKQLYKEINGYGYIEFKTPLEFAGPGTLVGGSPSSLSLVASPETCFPPEEDLYRVDNTTIPKKTHRVTVSNNTTVELANFLEVGTPTLGVGINFNIAKTVSMDMEGVHIEYLDSVRVTEYYNNRMSDICKEYLDHVGFIIQAMKAERLEVRFYDKHGVAINLGLQNVESIVDIGENVSWEVEDETVLIINTPKFIGYQLGSLRKEDGGYVLYRASKVKKDKYIFESLDIFDDDNFAKSMRRSDPGYGSFKDVPRWKEIRYNGVYRD